MICIVGQVIYLKKKKHEIYFLINCFVDDSAWLEAKDRCIMINAADVCN